MYYVVNNLKVKWFNLKDRNEQTPLRFWMRYFIFLHFQGTSYTPYKRVESELLWYVFLLVLVVNMLPLLKNFAVALVTSLILLIVKIPIYLYYTIKTNRIQMCLVKCSWFWTVRSFLQTQTRQSIRQIVFTSHCREIF